jgi:signal transduction histidine kinase
VSRTKLIQFPAGGSRSISEAKLELVELFLGSDDAAACAQRALEFLQRFAGVAQSLVLAAELEPERVIPIAAVGVSSVLAGEFELALEDRAHPLIGALAATQPVYFKRGVNQPHTPLEGTGFHAVPLRSDAIREERASALLLLSTASLTLDHDAQWVAEVLGEKLSRLRSRELLAVSRVGRERAWLLSVINAVTDPILLTNLEGKLIIANARAELLFTAPDDASEGRWRAVGLNNMLFSAALSAATIGQHATGRQEILLVDPSEGTDLLFELISSPVGDNAVAAILRNVTDLGRASAEIEESYRRLRVAEAEVRAERHRIELVMDSVADPILVTNPAGELVLLNEPAERLFTTREGTGEEVVRRVRANDAHFSSFVSNLLFSGATMRHRGEVLLVEPATGAGLPVEAVAGKVLSESGELTWVVTILHDRREAIENERLYEKVKLASEDLEHRVQAATAELAQQNELLRRQAIELEQASAMKSQFLANVSHELRTPLNAILGYTSMLIQGVPGPATAPQKKSMQRIDSNGRHLLTVINEILDITRIEAGKMPLHLTPFRVADLIQEVMSELEPIIARSRLKVSSECSPRLPLVRSDRQKVKQIVLNLLSNALKFTHEGAVRVSATHNPRRKQISIAVSDTGIGIAPEHHEKVFEDFRQVDNSPTRAYGGTGLGLSICRRLATMLDGSITLDSELGHGSVFSLHLPCGRRR